MHKGGRSLAEEHGPKCLIWLTEKKVKKKREITLENFQAEHEGYHVY